MHCILMKGSTGINWSLLAYREMPLQGFSNCTEETYVGLLIFWEAAQKSDESVVSYARGRYTRHFALAYLDNLVIYSSTWEEHIEHIGQCLEDEGLTAKPKICLFTMHYSNIVGNGMVRPELDKVEAV